MSSRTHRNSDPPDLYTHMLPVLGTNVVSEIMFAFLKKTLFQIKELILKNNLFIDRKLSSSLIFKKVE